MTEFLHFDPPGVERRLGTLGLSTELLHEIGRAAYVSRAGCSPLHPPTYPGTVAWGTAVFELRDKLLPAGWRHADPGNFSVTINDDQKLYVVVATGDQFAGRPIGKVPTTKTPKGLKTEVAVAATRQLTLFPDAIPNEILRDWELSSYQAWFLLFNIVERQVFIELSSPSEMKNGKIVNWHERIVLPHLSLDPVEDVKDGGTTFTPDIDVDIERIA